jgi:hypothetical protein
MDQDDLEQLIVASGTVFHGSIPHSEAEDGWTDGWGAQVA